MQARGITVRDSCSTVLQRNATVLATLEVLTLKDEYGTMFASTFLYFNLVITITAAESPRGLTLSYTRLPLRVRGVMVSWCHVFLPSRLLGRVYSVTLLPETVIVTVRLKDDPGSCTDRLRVKLSIDMPSINREMKYIQYKCNFLISADLIFP